MERDTDPDKQQSLGRLASAYANEKPRLVARLRAAGQSVEEAEDLAHEVYAEALERLPLLAGVRNLPAWLNALSGRRLIDAWRRRSVRRAAGETDVAEDTLREIIAGVGLDPLDGYVRDSLVDALHDAIALLPPEQRKVVEAQVFGGKSFREIAQASGESVDTLSARKRYAVRNLAKALRDWIED